MRYTNRIRIIVLTIYFIIFSSSIVTAQTVDFNKVILPETAKDIDTKERLIQLAWQNAPTNRILENNIFVAQKQVVKTRYAVLESFRANSNLNEFNINPADDEQRARATFFPRYNFSVGLSLGMLINNPTNLQIAKLELENQKYMLNEQKLMIRAQVLSLYEDYLMNKELLKLQNTVTEDSYNNFLIVEEQFRNGDVEIEGYSRANLEYSNSRKMLINAKRNYEQTKIELERIIGIDVSLVLGE